jgi:hypothetical protein
MRAAIFPLELVRIFVVGQLVAPLWCAFYLM